MVVCLSHVAYSHTFKTHRLLDGVLTLLSLSVTLPTFSALANHGFAALAKTTAGTLAFTAVLPRTVMAAGASAAFATTERFEPAFRALSLAAVVAWIAQAFLVALIASHLFLGAMLHASTAAVLDVALVRVLATLAVIVGLAVYVAVAVAKVLTPPPAAAPIAA